jgi:hypothetical protein
MVRRYDICVAAEAKEEEELREKYPEEYEVLNPHRLSFSLVSLTLTGLHVR